MVRRNDNNTRIAETLSRMSLREKASLCSGKDFWNTKSISRLEIPSVTSSDGPHGLRKQAGNVDLIDSSLSNPATCFPTSSATACSWDRGLLSEIGAALGEEALAEGVSVVLGPGANIKRSPLCGRNFEYFSEDPFLSGELAAAWIEGLQSKGPGASLKHFAVNNQERLRQTIDVIVDERALREIYLAGFERAVRKGRPRTVMGAYNRVNGAFCCEHERLLNDILRKEWGFEGIVVSDWGAVNDRVEGLKAGLDLEMPSSGRVNEGEIEKAVRSGRLDMAVLDRAVERLLRLAFQSESKRVPGYAFDNDAHHALARKAARESAVLLKNEGKFLPLPKGGRIAVLGAFAEFPRYQGSGSSLIHPAKLENALEGLREAKIDFRYAPGYNLAGDSPDEALIAEACALASASDFTLAFAGLPPLYESEGFDRESLSMPESHNRLIMDAAEAAGGRIAVVLSNGAPVEMPWLSSVPAVLECYLGGEAGGPAAIDLIFGAASPSGKLAETFPLSLEHCPCRRYFPQGPEFVEYRESLYVGYRYYDTAKKAVLFPFGHGLSYTEFRYGNLEAPKDAIDPKKGMSLSFTIENAGARSGAEIAQVYLRDIESGLFRPEKELKGFEKLFLAPGEIRKVDIGLDERAFAFYDPARGEWRTEAGEFEILVGSSSADIRLRGRVRVIGDGLPASVEPEAAAAAYRNPGQEALELGDEAFAALYGKPLPEKSALRKRRIHENSTISEARRSLAGKAIYALAVFVVAWQYGGKSKESEAGRLMALRSIEELPLRNVVTLSGGIFPRRLLRALVWMMNL